MYRALCVLLKNRKIRYFMNFVVIIAVCAVIASAAAFFVQQNQAKSMLLSVEKDKKALEEKEKLLLKEARIKAIEELQNDREKLNEEERERRQELARQEQKLAKREDMLEDKIQEYTEKDLQAQKKIDELLEKEDYLAEIVQKQTTELERISGMSAEDAKNMLLEQLKHDLAQEQMQLIRENEAKIKEISLEKSKEILSTTMQRCMIEQVVETTVSVVALPNDEMKGRIIGREGRNIRALETLTGVDLIIDDTPEAVILSSFDPVRREIARLALEKLVSDGRIHPARIEETIDKARREVDNRIREAGEQATFETGVHGLHPELVKLLGRLKYRTSYGQNVLDHSVEVSHLAGVMAAELGVDVNLAKRGGLLHDIGKAIDHEVEGSHVTIGADLAKRYRESKDVINAIAAHHGDYEATSVESVLVDAADAVSAARPGARRESLESYLKRLKQLEEIAQSFDGVERCFAIQAGREIRVMVKPDTIDDSDVAGLAHEIVKKIEKELEYPGQIKATVIREMRVVDYAK